VDELQYQIDLLGAQNRRLSDVCSVYRALVDSSGSAFLYYSYADDTIFTVGCWDKFFGIQIRNYGDLTKLFSLVREEDAGPLRTAVYVEETGGERACQEFCKKDGGQWISCEVQVILDNLGNPKEKLLHFKDITRAKQQMDNLSYMACYDTLTGLYNQNCFVRELDKWLDRASREKTVVSLAVLKINEFETMAKTGFPTDDAVLQHFGRLLGRLCREEKTMCAYLGGPCFAMALYDPLGSRTVESLYQQMREKLKAPPDPGDDPLSVSVQAGVAEYPEAAQTAAQLVERAQIALSMAKGSGRDIRYFDGTSLKSLMERAQLEKRLKNTALGDDFELYFQPQYEAATDRLRGLEALIRWKGEDGGLISPGEFLPIVEKSSVIISMGDWVLERAISRLAEWKKKYALSLLVSVNISPLHLEQEGFSRRLVELARRYGLLAGEIELEVSERPFLDDFSRICGKLELLGQYGIRAALDNFGFGCFPVSLLKNLPVQTVKMDRKFISGMLGDDQGKMIVESVAGLLNRLGYETVAVGVEEQEQFVYLREIGCDCIQGFLLGEPMSEQQIEELLEKQVWE